MVQVPEAVESLDLILTESFFDNPIYNYSLDNNGFISLEIVSGYYAPGDDVLYVKVPFSDEDFESITWAVNSESNSITTTKTWTYDTATIGNLVFQGACDGSVIWSCSEDIDGDISFLGKIKILEIKAGGKTYTNFNYSRP